MADPRWKEKMADGTTYEQVFVNILGKDKTVENFGTGKDEDPNWRSSPGAMDWLKKNYKPSGGKRRKTRKHKMRGGVNASDWDRAIEAAPETVDNMKEDLKRQLYPEEYNAINFEDGSWKSNHHALKWLQEYMDEMGKHVGGRKKKTRKNKKRSNKTKRRPARK